MSAVQSELSFASVDISALADPIIRANFEKELKQALAFEMGLDSDSEIIINSIAAGSVIVKFTLMIPTTKADDGLKSMQRLKESGKTITAGGLKAKTKDMAEPMAEGKQPIQVPTTNKTSNYTLNLTTSGKAEGHITHIYVSRHNEPRQQWQLGPSTSTKKPADPNNIIAQMHPSNSSLESKDFQVEEDAIELNTKPHPRRLIRSSNIVEEGNISDGYSSSMLNFMSMGPGSRMDKRSEQNVPQTTDLP
jgi:hypothetical protein